VKELQRVLGLGLGAAVCLVAIAPSPSLAGQAEVTGVQLRPGPAGLQILFNVSGNARPPVFTANRGNSSIADIVNSQLRLPNGGAFRQANPAPGITSVEVVQLDANTVRVTVNGQTAAPIGQVVRDNPGGGIAINFALAGTPAGPAAGTPGGQPPLMGQRSQPAVPYQPRAVAPPVGDIAIGPVDPTPDMIDLGSNERIPKLLLREAPVREVLTLLARAAGMNVAFAEPGGGGDPSAAGAGSGQTISLDIENESVQDVFNYVLRVTGLQANRSGRTIFVGKTLPPDAQNRIVRTFRLNQMKATAKTDLTQSLLGSAQTGGSVSGSSGSASSGGGGSSFSSSGGASTATTSLNRIQGSTTNIKQEGALEILQSYGANSGAGGDSGGGSAKSTLLRGLEVVADARTNSVTLVGTPRKVEIATSLLTQLDVRKRQAMVNVKFVDINLSNIRRSEAELGFGVGRFFGIGFNSEGLTIAQGRTPALGGLPAGDAFGSFYGSILLQVESNNAKVLTNPTLLIQEGSSAQVNLVQEIFSGLEATSSSNATSSGGAVATQTIKPIIRPAGVIFNVAVENIDDNGFITMSASPEVSSPSGSYQVIFPNVTSFVTGTLLAQRRLETGTLRLRDGQTLILSGIIQDSDRSEVTKVPILGDIPLLGRLFRRDRDTKNRSELVVLVTPKIVDDSYQSNFGYQYTPGPGQSITPPITP
jgi:type IV pilus assembly protein PilQ